MNGFKIKYSEISNHHFTGAVQKLTREALDIRSAYAVKRLVDKIQSALKDIQKEFKEEILSKYASKTAAGEIEYKDGGPVVPEDQQDAFIKAQEAFGLKEITIDRPKLAASTLMNRRVTLSASELTALEPLLLDDVSEEAEGDAVGPVALTPAG